MASVKCFIANTLKTVWTILLCLFLMPAASVRANPQFNISEINGQNGKWIIADLDGDGLEDLISLNGANLSIFFQDAKQGFPHEPQLSWRLPEQPGLIWSAKLGKTAGSLLLMTSDGVAELCATNRAGPPVIQQIIRQPTIIPNTTGGLAVVNLAMSAKTATGWPLLLLPTRDSLQVWQHRDEWRCAQVIALTNRIWLSPASTNPSYADLFDFDFSIEDVNRDGREDLMIRRDQDAANCTYTLYLQQSNGLFAPEPEFVYTDQWQMFSWLCWADLNHDGKLDLIKSVWINEPSFLPGVPSAKVVAGIYTADEHGQIPPQPQQVFRKSDWTPALPVVDVDGDGFQNLVLGYNHMASREGLTREITARQLVYTLGFYFYHPGMGFPQQADFQRDVVIRLDHLTNPLDWSLIENFQRSVSLAGDFNGDGKKDLLVRDHGNDLSVYFFRSRQEGFSAQPDLRFSCPEGFTDWQIADLNGDGVSDLMVKLAGKNVYRIFISQR